MLMLSGDFSLLFPVLFQRKLSHAWQATESITNYRLSTQDSVSEPEKSLKISVKTGKPWRAAAETGSPMTPRTANKRTRISGVFCWR